MIEVIKTMLGGYLNSFVLAFLEQIDVRACIEYVLLGYLVSFWIAENCVSAEALKKYPKKILLSCFGRPNVH